jgi:hypothetical protein
MKLKYGKSEGLMKQGQEVDISNQKRAILVKREKIWTSL